MTPLLGGVGLLARAVDYALACLDAADGADLTRPTPCADWDLRALLDHVNDSLLALHEAAALGRVFPETADDTGRDPIALVRDRATRLVGAWTPPVPRREVALGELALTSAIVTTTGALEVVVHGWDVARACGADATVPDGLATELLDLVPLLVAAGDRPARFATPIATPFGAVSGDRLVALLGRHPRWAYR
ncbi:TIGR03086 family metal-binding protein [Actinophytocola sp. NPDC049390]|uniref:TIGR03086 family metal-binding protein n=1 Tax=Actinophytocola sp. NPDC049390 TaxID=3363894 RepID=UPI0037B05D2F